MSQMMMVNQFKKIIYYDLDCKEKEEGNLFEWEKDEELEVTPKTTLNPKVVGAMKNLQASYNKDPNKIVEQAKQEKAVRENLNFLIDLATIAMWHRIKWL